MDALLAEARDSVRASGWEDQASARSSRSCEQRRMFAARVQAANERREKAGAQLWSGVIAAVTTGAVATASALVPVLAPGLGAGAIATALIQGGALTVTGGGGELARHVLGDRLSAEHDHAAALAELEATRAERAAEDAKVDLDGSRDLLRQAEEDARRLEDERQRAYARVVA